ncbi:MAG: hypothetical protein FJY97_06610 [candidate division Zixibacteria bacterium]|nr:hypothetical protein [candidate division Zixibacteria bacterium]
MDFIASGYIRLDGVISDAFNRKCVDAPPGSAKEFVGSPDFIREALLHPAVAGAVRSLLGCNSLVPPAVPTTYLMPRLSGKTGTSMAFPAPASERAPDCFPGRGRGDLSHRTPPVVARSHRRE